MNILLVNFNEKSEFKNNDSLKLLMKILITGGSGLVGSAVKHEVESTHLSDQDHTYYYPTHAECNLLELDKVIDFFDSIKPDVVIHLANKVGGLYANMNSNYNFLLDNTCMNANVLQACEHVGVKRLVNILSTCVFPDKAELPLTSDQILNSQPHDSNYGYAYSKRWMYIGSKALSDKIGLEVVNLIPTNLYGENDNYDLGSSHVIPGLIHKCYLAKLNDTPFEINGDGLAKRQFVYAPDFAKIILFFSKCELYSKFESIIVSPSESQETSIRLLASQIAHTFDFKGEIVYNTTQSNGQLRKTTNDRELWTYLPFFNFTPLSVGLEKVVHHFVSSR